MAGLDTFYESPPTRHQKETQIVVGVVQETAHDFDHDVHVVIPSFHPHRKIGPCGWTPKWTPKGVYFPHKGNHCTVALTDEGDPEIVRWKVGKKKKPDGTTINEPPDHSGTTDEVAQEIDDLQNGMDDVTGHHLFQAGRFAQTGGTYDE